MNNNPGNQGREAQEYAPEIDLGDNGEALLNVDEQEILLEYYKNKQQEEQRQGVRVAPPHGAPGRRVAFRGAAPEGGEESKAEEGEETPKKIPFKW